ncbi:MAG: hypothetical protein COA52_12505 [Hyphomicrobiales bacterium]|nr:MAG: hypothetical protein COA52_12505 [Hyphomicrobiales bacterium]
MKQPCIGLLRLDSRFPRIEGDIAHPSAFRTVVLTKIINAATPQKVVHNQMDDLLEAFVAAAIELEENGASLITTSCGFLALYQQILQDAVACPVLSSALFSYAPLKQLLPANKNHIGILTISSTSLTDAHLKAANIPLSVPIEAPVADGAFCTSILGNTPSMDTDKARDDIVTAANKLVKANPQLNAIILECTNMPPHKAAIEASTGIPVFSLMDVLDDMACGASLDQSLANTISQLTSDPSQS